MHVSWISLMMKEKQAVSACMCVGTHYAAVSTACKMFLGVCKLGRVAGGRETCKGALLLPSAILYRCFCYVIKYA